MLRVLRSSAPRFFTTTPLPRRRFSSIADSDPFQKVQIPRPFGANDENCPFDGYVFGKHQGAPGIIVLQDWLGVDHNVKKHALKISELGRGFTVLIPDLYRGDFQQPHIGGVKWIHRVMDVWYAAEWLETYCLGNKVGVTGFAMGGALALASADMVPSVDAVVAFYGYPDTVIDDPHKVGCPVQAHFGNLDGIVGFSDVKTANRLEENLKEAGVPYELHRYPGKGHKFMNMGMPDKDKDVELAWNRFESWMTAYLYH